MFLSTTGAVCPPAPLTGPLPLLTTAHSVGCRGCILAQTRTHIVDGAGRYRPRLMIVGEAPGADEDRAGTPFVGASGLLLRATLGELGMPPELAYFTNAVKCRPPGNRDPAPAELQACRQWLELEIEEIRPQSILCVGKIPEKQLSLLPAALTATIPVTHAWHPAYVLRNRSKLDAWKDQLRVALGHAPIGTVITPEPQFIEADPWLFSRWLAVDTETDEADPDDGGRAASQSMVCFQVSDGVRSQLYAPDDPMLAEIRKHRVHVQGAKFDLPLLGIDPKDTDAWDDTQLMAYVLREDEYGLKPQALKHHNLHIPPIQTLIGTGKKRIPFSSALKEHPEKARSYALKDAFGTALLAESQTRRLEEDPVLLSYYQDIEKPCLAVLLEMEQTGVLVDTDALAPLDALLTEEIQTSTQVVQQALGGINLASGRQLGQALLSSGFELSRTTTTGQLQTDEAALLACVGVSSRDDLDPLDHQQSIIAEILEIKRRSKLKSTYVTALPKARDANGRIHSRFNQCVTNTNRLSSSKPNLQNIPIRGPIRKTLRRIFVAPPGKVLVKADYSQLEVRIYAHYTREAVLLDAYLHREHDVAGPVDPDGVPSCLRCDVHQQVARALGIARFRAKNVLFGAIYGAAPPTLAVTAGVPSDQTVAFLGTMRRRLPSLLTWQASCADQLATRGYLETLLGWRGYFPHYWSPVQRERRSAMREAANFPIQGTAAGLVKQLMILADRGICGYTEAPLVLQAHDEVVYEVDRDDAIGFARDLEQLGAAVGELHHLAVPLRLDVQIGPNWGDLVDWRAWSTEGTA